MEYPIISEEEVTPSIFRITVLVLELIERHSLSLDYAASTVFSRRRVRPGERRTSYRLAWTTLHSFPVADLILRRAGYRGLPLRRVNAFREAYALASIHGFSHDKLSSIRGGLLGNKLLRLLYGKLPSSVHSEIRGYPVARRLAYEYALPPRITETLVSNLGASRAEKVAEAFSRRRVWLRPVSAGDVERLLGFLDKRGIRYRRDRDYDFLLEILVKPWDPLPEIPSTMGVYQDKASVAVAYALAGMDVEAVWDVAAAPLLKSAFLCKRGGVDIVATDVSERRLRSARGNVYLCNNIYPVVADARLPPVRCCFPGIMVDAPCTNSGAINRDPGLRLALWPIGDDEIGRYVEVQRSILSTAVRRLKEGGVLVYSTCSLFPEEGEELVGSLEGTVPLGFGERFPGECGYGGNCVYRRFFPDKEGTVAFFIAMLGRSEFYK